DGAIDIGSLTVTGNIVLNGGTGAGLITIDTTGDDVRFNGAVKLFTDATVTTGATLAGNILFTRFAPIDSQSGEVNDLTLTAGTGSVSFNANLGTTDRLDKLTVTRADGGVTFGGADTASG